MGVALIATLLCGCGTVGFSDTTGAATPPGYAYMTGNWQFAVTNPTGRATFTALAGFVQEASTGSDSGHDVTAELQLTPGNCFQGETTLPMYGTVSASSVSLRSFSDDGQFVTISGTENASADSFTGTFSVGGGCSNGGGGTLTGLKYAALTGSFSGQLETASGTSPLSLSLTQAATANGSGRLLLSGSATFVQPSCWSTAKVVAGQSYVLGKVVQVVLSTDDGASILLHGTFTQAADQIAIESGTVSGGHCSGAISATSLVEQ